MTDEVSNIIIAHLQAIRSEQRNTRDRLSALETHMVSVRRDQAENLAGFAMIQSRLDGVIDRLDRIETRLGLTDA